MDYKVPIESPDYYEQSRDVIQQIESIIQKAIADGQNKIFIYTNLKRGLPLNTFAKIASS